MTAVADVHVGDVGTLYQGEIQDTGAAFDPTTATTKELSWKLPNGTVITRGATISTTGTGPTQKWFLEYTHQAADLVAGLHQYSGHHRWQGKVVFPSGQTYRTNVAEYFIAGNIA
jgi:hypothetical protein